jgi:hypothetical protein
MQRRKSLMVALALPPTIWEQPENLCWKATHELTALSRGEPIAKPTVQADNTDSAKKKAVQIMLEPIVHFNCSRM